MKYREVTLADVCEWFQGRKVAKENIVAFPGDKTAYGIELTDGSQVVCESDWSGPYSELTPDVDADPPRFWIGEE
jgi:hypothetical protein